MAKTTLDFEIDAKYQAAVRWVFRQLLGVQLKNQELERKFYFKNKNKYLDLSKDYIALISTYQAAYACQQAFKDGSTVEGIDFEELSLEKHRSQRKKAKLNWLESHKGIIFKMRKIKMTYREMETTLRDQYDVEISRTYLCKFVKGEL
jgi:hypothetical protein